MYVTWQGPGPPEYAPGQIITAVIVEGDGSDASVNAFVGPNGYIAYFVVVNGGENYTWADISVPGDAGNYTYGVDLGYFGGGGG